MKVTEELILKFFRQECTADERLAVGEYFLQHPDEMDSYINERDWENFINDTGLDPLISKQMLDKIEQHIDRKNNKIVHIKKIAIAASIAAVIGIALLFNLSIYKQPAIDSGPSAGNKPLRPAYNDTVYNSTAYIKLVKLHDGSEISLSPKSELIFQHPFIQQNRDIYLKGTAFFKVAKDKTRPFTVYAGGLATTALGTSFRITAIVKSKKTLVQLFTGKVMIRQQRENKNVHQAVYLAPGEMLELNKESEISQVSTFKSDKPDAGLKEETAGRTFITGHVIKFNQQSLREVIKVLEKNYHIKIQANEQLMAKRTYTGTVDLQTETPDSILHTIAALNKFNVRKQGGLYILTE